MEIKNRVILTVKKELSQIRSALYHVLNTVQKITQDSYTFLNTLILANSVNK